MICRPHFRTLFPYTTLFRSYQIGLGLSPIASGLLVLPQAIASIGLKAFMPAILARLGYRNVLVGNTVVRSEEHTSELQSPCNIVCRLLLEKKKTQINNKIEI